MFKKKNIKYILLSALIAYIFIFSDIGIISKFRLDKELKHAQLKINQLEAANEKLAANINRLKIDLTYIAELARKLGYAKTGEKIYRFYENTTNSSQLLQTNIISSENKFQIKDYLIYIITFILVLGIYIVLIITQR